MVDAENDIEPIRSGQPRSACSPGLDKDKANRRLRRPLTELGNETPIVVAQTEAGARVIETILGKIAWGAAA